MPYVDTAVVPLGMTTAACWLFQSDLLALELPTATRQARDQWVIIWGGATSVGCNAIQLAVAAGYSVVTTTSPKNFDYVKSLGAAYAFDYKSESVVGDIIAALKGKTVMGALSIGAGSNAACIEILGSCEGRKFVASCSAPVSFELVAKGRRITLPGMATLVIAMLRSALRTRRLSRRHKVTEKFSDASSVVDNTIGRAIYRDYLGPALAAGSFRPSPPPRVVGHSLADIQTAMDIQRKGVSASKIVVALS